MQRDANGRATITTGEPAVAVREWFVILQRCVQAVDYETARGIFAEDVVSFGTRAEVVSGLDRLRQNQWQGVWPYIRDFAFALDQLVTGSDGAHAWGVVPWTSMGFDQNGTPFDRPGRATTILERRAGRWLSVHTHFSLAPGTPPQSFGPNHRT